MSVLDGLRERIAEWLLDTRAVERVFQPSHTVHAVDEDPLRRVQLARVFHARKQRVAVTKRQDEWLQRHKSAVDVRYIVNVCRVVEQAYRERLHLQSVGVSGGTRGQSDLVEELLARYAIPPHIQQELFEAALVDGVAFLFTDFQPALQDGETGTVEYRVERLLVPESAGGDGEGIVPLFVGDAPYPRGYARIWKETIPDPRTNGNTEVTVLRKTEYMPGSIWRYIKFPDEEDWRLWPDETSGVQEWRWYPNGVPEALEEGSPPLSAPIDIDFVPLPPPISAWMLPDMRSALDDIVPPQAMLDKVWLNLMMAADWAGTGIMAFLGWVPTVDGKPLAKDRSNLLYPVPGDYLYTARPANEVGLTVTFPTNVSGLLDLESRLIARLSAVSGVPQSAFVSTRQVASEGTLKQQESALIARVQGIQASFDAGVRAWAEGLLAQIVAFSDEAAGLDGWDMFQFYPVWRSPQVRNDREDVELAKEKLESLGFDLTEVWRGLGLTDDQINEMIDNPFAQALIAEAEARVAMAEEQKQFGKG